MKTLLNNRVVTAHNRSALRGLSWLIPVALFALRGADAPAANRTWDGGGSDNNWGTAANWNASIAANDSLFFGGSTRLTPNNNTSPRTDYSGLTFNLGAGVFTLSGNAIDLLGNGGVTNNSANAQTINLGIRLLGDVTFTSSGGLLTIGGAINESGSANKTLTITGPGNMTINGDITSSSNGFDLRLFKSGSGTLTLSGANTFDGGTTISGGTVSISANGNLGAASGGLTFANGATLRTTGATPVNLGTRAITLNSGGGNLDLGIPLYFSGAINGGNGLTTGGSDLILNRASGNNTIGAITVNSGRLFIQNTLGNINGSTIAVQSGGILAIDINAANVLGNTVTFASGAGLANRQGTLSLSTATANLPTAGTMIFNSDDQPTTAINLTGNYPTLSGDLNLQVGGVNATVGAVTLGGTVSGNGGLNKTSTGTLILGAANSYTGDTTVSAGTLQLGNAGALPSGAGAGNVTVNGTLSLQDLSVAINGLNGSGTIRKDAGAASTRTLTVGNNNASGNFGGVITDTSGTLNVVKTGTGTQVLSGNNSYDGTTTINTGGALNIQHANALGGTGAGTTVGNGAALQLQGGITTAAEALTINGSGVANDGALRNLSGNNTYVGAITLASASRINSDSGTLTLAGGAVTDGGKGLTVGGGGDVTFTTTAISGAGTVTKDGAGTLRMNVASTYTGGTTLNQGTLLLGADHVLPNAGTLTFAGGILDANDRTDVIGALSLSGNSSLILHNNGTQGILTFDSATYSGGTLTIYGWQGSAGGPNTASGDQILINAPSQSFLNNLQNVQFDLGGQLYFGKMSGNELMPELAAVPEPINVALGVFGGVFVTIGWIRRFRTRRPPEAS